VNRTKELGGGGAPEKLRTTRTQAAKSKAGKLKQRFRHMPPIVQGPRQKILHATTSMGKRGREGHASSFALIGTEG